MTINSCTPVRYKDLKEYDIVLTPHNIAALGGALGIVLFRDRPSPLHPNGYNKVYPLGWADLSNPQWKEELQSKISGEALDNYFLVGKLIKDKSTNKWSRNI